MTYTVEKGQQYTYADKRRNGKRFKVLDVDTIMGRACIEVEGAHRTQFVKLTRFKPKNYRLNTPPTNPAPTPTDTPPPAAQ